MNNQKKIALACSKCSSRNYTTYKTIEERLKIKKYCNSCREHNFHKEEK